MGYLWGVGRRLLLRMQATRWAMGLSRPPDLGCSVTKFVPYNTLKSIWSGKVDGLEEDWCPPSVVLDTFCFWNAHLPRWCRGTQLRGREGNLHRVSGLGFKIWTLGFRVSDFGLKVEVVRFRVYDLGESHRRGVWSWRCWMHRYGKPVVSYYGFAQPLPSEEETTHNVLRT